MFYLLTHEIIACRSEIENKTKLFADCLSFKYRNVITYYTLKQHLLFNISVSKLNKNEYSLIIRCINKQNDFFNSRLLKFFMKLKL